MKTTNRIRFRRTAVTTVKNTAPSRAAPRPVTPDATGSFFPPFEPGGLALARAFPLVSRVASPAARSDSARSRVAARPSEANHASVSSPGGPSWNASGANASDPTAGDAGSPASSRHGHQGDNFTVFPTMMSVGDSSPRFLTASGKASTVPNTRRSRRVVPRSTATAGMSSGNPDSMSFSASRGSVPRPMYTTSVVSTSAEVTANATGSATALPVPSLASFAAPSLKWPVRSRTEVAAPLCVRGIPSSLPTPAAAVIPGTICTAYPRFMSVSISSPPRPNTSGSPPFRRTTDAPFSAKPRSMRSISSCVRVWNPACLPT